MKPDQANEGHVLETSLTDIAAALQWYSDIGWDEAVYDVPQNRLVQKDAFVREERQPDTHLAAGRHIASEVKSAVSISLDYVDTLDALKKAVTEFDGLAICKTATNMVFGDGNPVAKLMVIGEAPDAEDDRIGRAFSGESGALLDKMMAAIGLERTASEPEKSVYLSCAVNWRPPGERSLSPAEMDVACVILKKHIELVRPQFLLLMGSVPARMLLGVTHSMTKLRGKWFDYGGIPCLVSYPPSFLLKSPTRKRESWEDLQSLHARMQG